MTGSHQRRQTVTVHGPGPCDVALIPVDTLPEPGPDVSVTPWSEAAAGDWQAPHIRFGFRWEERHAGLSISDINAEACTIAARLLTQTGHAGAATLHPLPLVDFTFQYLVRPLATVEDAP